IFYGRIKMPLISTNKPELHRRLKIRAAENKSTIGKTVDLMTEFGLEFGVDQMEEDEIEALRKFMKSRGVSSLGKLFKG
ncbi:hypothetical protein C4588_02035, partial [Candidatus Parcubacteria bacterium]